MQRPYLSMEFVDGRSLSDILEEGPLTFDALGNLVAGKTLSVTDYLASASPARRT